MSTVNLDYSVNHHFKESQHEISYCDVRLQPLIFQDDLSRLSSILEAAQAGNIYIKACIEPKLLDLNTDKSCFIILGDKKMVKNIQSEMLSSPLSLCGAPMKEKVSDKYLGDYIHTSGPRESVNCTVSNRFGRTLLGILETRAIIDDCRINTVGGIQAGIDYWEMAYLPSLINNSQTWTQLSEKSIEMLDDLQNTMYRVLLNVPRTCPKPALCWEMGGIQMELRVVMKKLNFLWHLANLDEASLAKEIFQVQKEHKLPGLVSECLQWINTLDLPNVLKDKFTQLQWKKKVRE